MLCKWVAGSILGCVVEEGPPCSAIDRLCDLPLSLGAVSTPPATRNRLLSHSPRAGGDEGGGRKGKERKRSFESPVSDINLILLRD